MNTSQLISHIESELVEASNSNNALKMSAYMKNRFSFYGIKAPLRTAILRPLWQQEQASIKKHIRALSSELWTKDHRECQMVAMELMGKCKKGYSEADLLHLESLITTKSWWDTVDFLATTIIGHILKDRPNLARSKALEYMNSDNMWLQRTALIFQLKYRQQTDEALLYELIPMTFGGTEFFINKASGWALRQHSKLNSMSVATFIAEHRPNLAKLTIKEGSKYL